MKNLRQLVVIITITLLILAIIVVGVVCIVLRNANGFLATIIAFFCILLFIAPEPE